MKLNYLKDHKHEMEPQHVGNNTGKFLEIWYKWNLIMASP